MTFEKAASFLFAIKYDIYPDYWQFNMQQIVFFSFEGYTTWHF